MSREDLDIWGGVAEREAATRHLAAIQAASAPYMEDKARGEVLDDLHLRTMTDTQRSKHYASQRDNLRRMLKR